MSDERILAESIGKTEPHAVTFQVTDFFLDEIKKQEWSEPVLFRFVDHGGRWDLECKTVES